MDEDLAATLTNSRDDSLAAFAAEAAAAAMAAGLAPPPDPLALRELAVLVRAAHASFVLQLGAGAAVATVAIASGLGRTGRLDAVEPSPVAAASVVAAIRRFSLEERVRLHQTTFADALNGLAGPYDLVVALGPDPAQVAAVYEEIVRVLRVGATLAFSPVAGAATVERLATDVRLLPSFGRANHLTVAVRVR